MGTWMFPKWLQTTKQKKCNVILSAGGIRALAHIGALQALEEEGWKVENICGISAGAVVASFYASGHTIEQMKGIALSIKFKNFIKFNLPKLHLGLLKFVGFGSWVADECLKKIETERKCQLHIGACSITTGRRKVFTNPWTKDLLSIAVESTCSVPVLFKLVEFGEEMLADGALWSSAPVHYFSDKSSPAYNKLPTFVINVQNSHHFPFTEYNKPHKLLYRIFEVFQMNRLTGLRKRIKGKKVCVIEPYMPNVAALSFKTDIAILSEVIESGYRSTKLALKEGKFDG